MTFYKTVFEREEPADNINARVIPHITETQRNCTRIAPLRKSKDCCNLPCENHAWCRGLQVQALSPAQATRQLLGNRVRFSRFLISSLADSPTTRMPWLFFFSKKWIRLNLLSFFVFSIRRTRDIPHANRLFASKLVIVRTNRIECSLDTCGLRQQHHLILLYQRCVVCAWVTSLSVWWFGRVRATTYLTHSCISYPWPLGFRV